MGMDISEVDLLIIEMFANRVVSLAHYRKQLAEYLKSKMTDIAPNLATLIEEQVGARLIAHADSLTNLAEYPASTVQILGAEKALFRALITRENASRYGLIFHSTFIGRAGIKNKGQKPSRVFGEHLRQQVEDRLKFYETEDVPKKNIEVMKEALEVYGQQLLEDTTENDENKKKKKKRKANQMNRKQHVEEIVTMERPKKKKKKSAAVDKEVKETENGETTKKKEKKSVGMMEDGDEAVNETIESENGETPKKKKKKKKASE
nr:unnamed protein product [Callosobruchus chinensis]